jgi:hypothetical protein
MSVSAVECAATALAVGICRYALIPLCSRFYSGRRARQMNADPGTGLQSASTIRDYYAPFGVAPRRNITRGWPNATCICMERPMSSSAR